MAYTIIIGYAKTRILRSQSTTGLKYCVYGTVFIGMYGLYNHYRVCKD